MAIYEVTYWDADGNALHKGTFNAEDLHEAFDIVMTTPSLEPPEGTHDIDIRRLDKRSLP